MFTQKPSVSSYLNEIERNISAMQKTAGFDVGQMRQQGLDVHWLDTYRSGVFMQSTLLSHSLAVEFPELADAVHRLKADNAHFARLLAEHDAIDQKIARDEQKIEVLNDETLHELKQQRLKLKDELYQIATSV